MDTGNKTANVSATAVRPGGPRRSPACEQLSIILIDDDSTLRSALAAILRDDGHEVQEFGAPEEVPSLTALAGVAVLVTDYELPGMDGLAFADGFHACYPDVPVVLVTAHQARVLQSQTVARSFLSVQRKPFDYDALHAHLHERCAGAVPR